MWNWYELDFQRDFYDFALVVSHFDVMQAGATGPELDMRSAGEP
jgi:hypothetical protein